MSEIVAKCSNPRCYAVFNMPSLASIEGKALISFSDVGTACPRCGSNARILDGTYGGSPTGSPVLQFGPPETIALVEALRAALAAAKQGATAEEVVDSLSQVSPELGQAARGFIARRGLSVLISLLMIVLAACTADVEVKTNVEVKIDGNRVYQDLMYYLTGKMPFDANTATIQAPEAEPRTANQSESAQQRSEPQQKSGLNKSQQPQPERLSKRQKRRAGQWHSPKKKARFLPKAFWPKPIASRFIVVSTRRAAPRPAAML